MHRFDMRATSGKPLKSNKHQFSKSARRREGQSGKRNAHLVHGHSHNPNEIVDIDLRAANHKYTED